MLTSVQRRRQCFIEELRGGDVESATVLYARSRAIRQRACTVTLTGDIHVPLIEEEVVVEKRPVVKEELIVGKRIVEERDTVETDVRREKFDIDENSTPGSSNRGTRGQGR